MYKTILVPLDGSERAEAILPHVEPLARSFGSRVIFLQVVEPPRIAGYEGFDPHAYQQELEYLDKQAQSYLQKVTGRFEEKGLKTESRATQGSVVSTILETAEDLDAQLIAMASHGRGGLARVFYGSVAAGVLQRIDRPILVIRSRQES
jgi:nucleotide-binding universal stress UspA family protein